MVENTVFVIWFFVNIQVGIGFTEDLCPLQGIHSIADCRLRTAIDIAFAIGIVNVILFFGKAVLVDVGVSRVYDEEAGRYRIKGDVDKACYDKASAYTPNPGGVGPMTRAMLLANVVEMAERHA